MRHCPKHAPLTSAAPVSMQMGVEPEEYAAFKHAFIARYKPMEQSISLWPEQLELPNVVADSQKAVD